jgi:hypothetical protein
MYRFHIHRVTRELGAFLVHELDRGTSFRAALEHAGVSRWDVLVWCLRGRWRYHDRPLSPKDRHSLFLLALAEARRRNGSDLGLIINRLVRPFESYSRPPSHA